MTLINQVLHMNPQITDKFKAPIRNISKKTELIPMLLPSHLSVVILNYVYGNYALELERSWVGLNLFSYFPS